MRERKSTDSSQGRAKVGYQHPPADTQFKTPQSGNPAGRPTGRLNAANLIKEIFNETVAVREGNRTRRLPACEAIIRSSVAKAGQGDTSALFTVMDLIEMSGRMDELGDEELRARQMMLPGSFTADEYDLTISPAREPERQRYLAIFEQGEGYLLAAQNEPEAALAVYRRDIKACKDQVAHDLGNAQAAKGLARAIAGIGLLADKLLHAGEFRRALACANEAISEGSELTWARVIRAHALMFLGDVDGARAIYLQLPISGKGEPVTSWQSVILGDFARLRQAGHRHALMDEIEERYVAEGCAVQPATKSNPPAVSPEEATFILANPDSIKTGDLLAQQGELDRALAAYRGNLAKCKAKLGKDASHVEGKENLQIASGRIGLLAGRFLLNGGFGQGLECAEEAISHDPHSLALQANHAHALMFIGRPDEARQMFLQFRGQNDPSGKSWEKVILEDFAQFRAAGRSRLLMDEIEKKFGASGAMPGQSPLPQPDDIPSGNRLAAEGKLDEALAVYRRRLASCQKKLANKWPNLQAVDDKYLAIEKIVGLVNRFLLGGDPGSALIAADAAIAAAPEAPLSNLCRAHALMFLERADEARTLYLRYRDEKMPDKRSGKDLILQDFAKLREAGRAHPLTVEIETLFAAGG